jgi:hypothetical protein
VSAESTSAGPVLDELEASVAAGACVGGAAVAAAPPQPVKTKAPIVKIVTTTRLFRSNIRDPPHPL